MPATDCDTRGQAAGVESNTEAHHVDDITASNVNHATPDEEHSERAPAAAASLASADQCDAAAAAAADSALTATDGDVSEPTSKADDDPYDDETVDKATILSSAEPIVALADAANSCCSAAHERLSGANRTTCNW